MRRYLARWLQPLESALLPPTCLLCGAPGARGRDLCAGCARDLSSSRPVCRRCGEAVPEATPAPCGRCQRRPPAFDCTRAALRYRAPADRLVVDLKFHGRLPAARLLGALLLDAVRDAEPPEALIPVPLHPSRLRERGFNQAVELARPLAHGLGIPLWVDAVNRVRNTPPQTELDYAARRRNIRGAFTVRAPLDAAHVAIVDDVMTTGSTMHELARTLRRAGVRTVQVWVAARALHDETLSFPAPDA